jgi:hypothetical protein
MGLFPHSQVE